MTWFVCTVQSSIQVNLSKTATLKKYQKMFFKTNYRLIRIKLPLVIKIFVLSIFEWLLKTVFFYCIAIFWFSGMEHVIGEPCYKGTVLHRNYRKIIFI